MDDTIYFGEDTSDEKLIEKIRHWKSIAEPYHNQLLRAQNVCVEYYLGNQTERDNVQPFNSDTVFNRIFEATETLVPIVTGTAHTFVAMPSEESDMSMRRAQRVQNMLGCKYRHLDMPKRLECVVRDIILKRFGVIEYGWDVETDDINVWVRDPRSIIIPKLNVETYELPYVMKIVEFDREELESFFPDADYDELKKGITTEVSRSSNREEGTDVYQVLVTMTRDYWVYSQGDIVLKRMRNPYFDWSDSEEVEEDSPLGKVKRPYGNSKKNYLKRPEIPLVFFTPFTTGESPIAETSLAEVAIPIQDDINVSKRQILDNLRRMGNGQVYVDTGAMSEEDVESITNEPGLILVGKNLASESRIRRETATAIPATHFSNLADSIQSFDNVFGTHGAIRGQAQSETLGGQMLDRQQNLSRIEQITREINRGVSHLANGLVQLMKLFYTEKQVIRVLNEEGAIEFMEFISDDIDNGVVIEVRSGNSVSLDPQSRYNQAIQLWQLGAIDPETLFERLEYPEPQMSAQKLGAWRAGQLLFEAQINANAGGGNAPIRQAGAPGQPNEAQGRNVETRSNSIQRSQEDQNAGGRAPLKNTPKQ